MRLLPISKCQPGMRLGKSIFSEDGRVLLMAEVELTDSMIRRLGDKGIDYIYIMDKRTEDIVIPDLISDETRARTVTQIRSSFRSMMGDANRKQIPGALAKDFKDVLTMIIDDLSGNKDAMIMLTDMNLKDHYLYTHSMNVCIYSCMLAMHMGFTRSDIFSLGLGSLLHDIGKTKIPLEILNKKGKLNSAEYSIMQKHAELGYHILKEEANIPLVTAHCALQHHERMNGTGYPRGLKGSEIHDFAQWIGIVDSYDAMTTHRVYRETLMPHQAMEILYAGASDSLYAIEKVEAFRDKIALYPLGITVKLNTGESGVVVDINATSPHRPVIRVLENEAGEQLHSPYEIDLSKQLSVMVTNYTNEHNT